MKPTLLVTRPLPHDVIARAETFFDVTLAEVDAPLEVGDARSALAQFDMILCTLGDGFTREAFDGLTARTKLLANFGVGYNHIDVGAAARAGVMVSNTPGAVTDATADIAMTLMLMTLRRASEGERLARSGAWSGWAPMQLLGTHMSGKHVGIVGMGRIGQAIAQRCHFGFGMEVSYFNRSEKDLDFPARQVPDLHALLGGVDVVVVAVPGGAETRHLIDKDALAAMRPDAYLINIARGDVIDEAALIDALEAHRIAGAGLDVYEFEPQIPARLRQLDQVVLLPHLGTSALEVRSSMGMMAVDNLIAAAEGREPPNRVLPA